MAKGELLHFDKDSYIAMRQRELQAIQQYRAALERCVQTLEVCGPGEPHPTHDAVITGLAQVCGAGDMMRAIVHDWHRRLIEIHGIGAHAADNYFTVGPTRDSVISALRVGRAALEQKT